MELANGDGATMVSWSDRVVLTRQRGRRVIDEIELLGGWPFANQGKIGERLDAVVREVGCPSFPDTNVTTSTAQHRALSSY